MYGLWTVTVSGLSHLEVKGRWGGNDRLIYLSIVIVCQRLGNYIPLVIAFGHVLINFRYHCHTEALHFPVSLQVIRSSHLFHANVSTY